MTDIDYLEHIRSRGGLTKGGKVSEGPWTGSRWRHYLRCDECGVDAGKACRDDNDREALVVCDGRILKVRDSADRLEHGRREKRASRRATVDVRPQAKSRRARDILAEPVYVPCQHCQTPTRLWGAACVTGSTWCGEQACRDARTRTRNAAGNERRRVREQTTPRTAPKVRRCVICGADVSAHGVPSRTEAACPGACREARWAQRYAIQFERARVERAAKSPPPVSCHWCRATIPGTHRTHGVILCCGEITCERAKRRDQTARSRAKRRQEAVDPQQQQHA